MAGTSITVAGIEIPSTDPVFLAFVALHVSLGLACTITGIVAMLSRKVKGRHPKFGTIYYWCLLGLCVSAGVLAVFRWGHDNHLVILGALAFGAAYLGRRARRNNLLRLHVTGMGASYILLLTAFYVDNGKDLPIWRELPPLAYWLVPAMVGIPLIVRALLRHPLLRPRLPPPSP